MKNNKKALSFIKKYNGMVGRKVSMAKVRVYVRELQNAFQEGQISDTSEHKKALMNIQAYCIDAYNKNKGNFVVLSDRIDHAKGKPKRTSKSNKVNNGLGDRKIPSSLKKELKGLTGLGSLACPADGKQPAQDSIISSNDITADKYKYIDLGTDWSKLFGKPNQNFCAVLAAREGAGKSTLAIDFAKYWAENVGKALYVSSEQFDSASLANLIDRRNARHEQLSFARAIPAAILGFNLIVLDSFNDSNLTAADLKSIRSQNPDTAFVFVVRLNDDGSFRGRGAKDVSYDSDISIKIEDGVAKTEKNRFGPLSEMNIQY